MKLLADRVARYRESPVTSIGRSAWPLVVGILFAVATIAFVLWMYGRDPNLPKITKLEDYHFKQSTKVLDRNDHLIGTLGEHRKEVVDEREPRGHARGAGAPGHGVGAEHEVLGDRERAEQHPARGDEGETPAD